MTRNFCTATATPDEKKMLVDCALGRIFGMMQRPFQPGDVEEYEACRRLVLDLTETREEPVSSAPLPGWNFGRGNTGSIE